MKFAHSTLVKILILSLVSLTTPGCERELPTHNRIYGPVKPMGEGIVRSFIESDNNGRPQMVAIIFPESALTDLPGKDQIFKIKLPFKKKDLALDHVLLSWEPSGSNSPESFTKPYFHIHFNTIPTVISNKSLVKDAQSPEMATADFLPASNFPTPDILPKGDMNRMNSASPELQPADVTQTFLIGAFDEKLISYGSMVSMDYLMKKGKETYSISVPKAYKRSGKYYPTQYSISYNQQKKQYSVELLKFKKA